MRFFHICNGRRESLKTFPPSIEMEEHKFYLHQVFMASFAYNLHVLELKDS